jgi:hypothetical protein
MKKELAIFFGIIVLVGITLYMYPWGSTGSPEEMPLKFNYGKEISYGQLGQVVSDNNRFSIVYYAEKDAAKNQVIINNCTIPLSFSLAYVGKNVSTYMFDSAECTGLFGGNKNTVKLNDCIRRMDNTYVFLVRYGNSQSRFYEHLSEIFISEEFNSTCGVTERADGNATENG